MYSAPYMAQYGMPQQLSNAKPMEAGHPHMMRVNQCGMFFKNSVSHYRTGYSIESPYQVYPQMMPGHAMPEHSPGMGMYLQPGIPNHGYMMPPPQMPPQMPKNNGK